MAALHSPNNLHATVLGSLRCDVANIHKASEDKSQDELSLAIPCSADDSLVEAWLQVAATRPQKAAIEMADVGYSYGAIARAAWEIAAHLQQDVGVKPGDRVAILLPNGPEYLAAFYGILLAGGVATPLPPQVESHRLKRVHAICQLSAVVTDEKTIKRRREFEPESTTKLDIGASAETDASPRVDFVPPNRRESLAMIMFTSGSSGEPKGVMLSHENLLANSASIVEYLEINADERPLALLPFYHAFGNSVVHSHMLKGATLVVDGSLTFPETVLEALHERKATSFSAVPEAYHALLRFADFENHPLPHLHTMTVAGGGLPAEDVATMAAKLAPAKFVVMYGQTEASPRLAFLPAEEISTRAGSIGKAIPGVELAVLDADDNPAPVGQVGELCARGANIMQGYWGEPQATGDVLRNGWLHTGDLALRDDEGYFYVKARRSGLVKVQGYRLHPREVEQAVAAAQPSWRVVVAPYQRENTTRLAMFVVGGKKEIVTVEAVRDVCRRELSRLKQPAYIEVLETLPLNDSFKLDRQTLAKKAAENDQVSTQRKAG